jgi:hypothetical protein
MAGRGLTVIHAVTEQLLLLTYVIVVVPGLIAVTSPEFEIAAIAALEDVHALVAAGVGLAVS